MEASLPLDHELDRVDAATGQKGPTKKRKRKREISEAVVEETEAIETKTKKVTGPLASFYKCSCNLDTQRLCI